MFTNFIIQKNSIQKLLILFTFILTTSFTILQIQKKLNYTTEITSFKKKSYIMCSTPNYYASKSSKPYSGILNTPVGSNITGLYRWSQATTWNGGSKPTAIDDVIIPANSVVVLNEDITVKSITVKGKLIVDLTKNISINTSALVITGNEGYFEWGTAIEPYVKNGKITLVGATSTINAADNVKKSIMIMDGGLLEIHGNPKKSWTHLKATVNPGDNIITLKDDISSWNIGDSIVVASTDYKYNHSEARVINGIQGKRITLNSPLNYRHFGEITRYKNNTIAFDERAEVGLLTRNIVIQGDETGALNKIGGHIMVMPTGIAHIENIELFRMGQEGLKGRYPFHWHLCGDVSGQYIKNSSIHFSYNRLVVVHGSNSALIEDNVGYNHRGHGYVLEDGDEEFNTFKNNLGLLSLRAETGKGIEAQDEENVATFWITNPNNSFIGNVAAGSQDTGFWLIPVSTLLRSGAVLSNSGNPRDYSLKLFTDNVGHSNNRNLALDGNLASDPANPNGPRLFDELSSSFPIEDRDGLPLEYVFENFTTYKARSQGVWSRASATERYINCKFGDAPFMAFLAFNASVKNSIFVAQSNNTGTGSDYTKPLILGMQMYNGSTDFENVHLAGFTDNTRVAIGTRQSSGKYPNFTASGITFEENDPNYRVNFNKFDDEEDPARSFAFASGLIDLDGTITGTPNARIAPKIINTNPTDPAYNNRIYDPEFILPKQPERIVQNLPNSWNAVASVNTRYGLLFNKTNWPLEEFSNQNDFVYGIRNDGPVVCDKLRKATDSQWPVILNEDYIYYTQYHDIPFAIESEFLWTTNQNDYVVAAYLNMPSQTKVVGQNATNNPQEVNSLKDLLNSTVTSYFFKDNTLYVKYFTTVPDPFLNTSVLYTDYSCPTVFILQTTSKTSNQRYDYATLADYEVGVDSRATIKTLGGAMRASSITGDGIDADDAIDHKNTFTITKQNNTQPGYVEYSLTTTKQVWREFKTLSLNYAGSPVEVIVKDASQGEYSLGLYQATDCKAINLRNIPPQFSDEIIGLSLRFHSCYLTTNSKIINLWDITLTENIPALNSASTVIANASVRSSNTILCNGQNALLTATLHSNYQWYRNATPITGATQRTYTATTPGVYQVLTQDGSACKLFSSPLTITKGTSTDCSRFSTDDITYENDKITIYPNPSYEGIFNLNTIENWEVYNLVGQKIKQDSNKLIDLSNQANGVYFVRIRKNNYVQTFKIVKN